MCSRYNLISPPDAVRAYFDLPEIEAFPPRYNIAPSQPVGIVRRGLSGEREFRLVRWGLVPGWVKDPDPLKRTLLFNARAETAAEKPSFRGALRHRRCLVPADGFYEWSGPKGRRQPHLFRGPGGGPMALAGLAEHWLGGDGSELETMAILTVPANRSVAPVHDRMPLILKRDFFEAWLDCRSGDAGPVAHLLTKPGDDDLACVAVSPLVNSVTNEGPALLAPDPTRLL